MSKLPLKQRIREGLFILDGGMGSELIKAGVEPGTCNDYLNIQNPELISRIHKAYLDAGSDAILTNTFGANKYALVHHDLAQMVRQINKSGAELARKTAGDEKYVIGDIGPTGGFLAPLGMLQPNQLRQAFAEQAEALTAGGVNGFIIETMSAVDEAEIAVEAIKSVCDLPIFVSFAYNSAGSDYRTMMGIDVDTVVKKFLPLGVSAMGFNCGTVPMDGYAKIAEKYVKALAGKDIAILAEPNAGQPELVNNKSVYKLSPPDFAAEAEKIYSAGATIIGGCCGTTSAHIKAMCEKIVK